MLQPMKVKHIAYIFVGVAAWQLLPEQQQPSAAETSRLSFITADSAKHLRITPDQPWAAKRAARRYHHRTRTPLRPLPTFTVQRDPHIIQQESEDLHARINAEIMRKCNQRYAAIGGCYAQMRIAEARDKERMIAAARARKAKQTIEVLPWGVTSVTVHQAISFVAN